jgi:serine/threonine protein kinase
MIGETLGRYRIVERLGEGGMGVVFRAEDPRLERDVALKVLKQDALHDEDSKRRFRLEARALSRLLHPNIATLFDFDSDGGVDFLVLEFVPGESLSRTLANGPLPETRARAIALDVTEGLQSAHEKGIIHRDLKPGNVIITPRGRAKVLDFGLARVLTGAAEVTQPATAAVPPPWSAPCPICHPSKCETVA